MFRFILNCFTLIGFLTFLSVAALFALAVGEQRRSAAEPAKIVLTVDFTRPIVEQVTAAPLTLSIDGDPLALFDVLSAIDKAAKDPRVVGLTARFGGGAPSLSKAQEIRSALMRFRNAGKFSYAYGSDYGEFGFGNRAYFLASAFEHIWLQPVGTVSLTGVSLQTPFAKGAFDKLGIVADFMQREEYKSFMEAGQREKFSPPVKAEMEALVANIAEQIAWGISLSRKWDVDHVKDLMARGPYTDEEAALEGVITRLAYADEFDVEVERRAGKDAVPVDIGTYLSYESVKDKQENRTSIALIHGTGLIMDKGFDGGDLAGERILGADVVAEAFSDAAKAEHIKAIVFRIDSPGGSPAASETIRRAVINAKKQGKPVIVSMGDAAASGGYWIAMNADRILANPATLTGSIGVVAGKFAIDGLLEKAGISMDGASTAPNAGMWTVAAQFSPEQRARINALLDNTYRSFVKNVSSARKIPIEKMPDVAKGRVFTGEQALKVGLVDELGGYDAALNVVRKSLSLDAEAPLYVEVFPAPPSMAERLLRFMRRFNAESAALFSFMNRMSRLWGAVGGSMEKATGLVDLPVSALMRPLETVYE